MPTKKSLINIIETRLNLLSKTTIKNAFDTAKFRYITDPFNLTTEKVPVKIFAKALCTLFSRPVISFAIDRREKNLTGRIPNIEVDANDNEALSLLHQFLQSEEGGTDHHSYKYRVLCEIFQDELGAQHEDYKDFRTFAEDHPYLFITAVTSNIYKVKSSMQILIENEGSSEEKIFSL